MCGADTEMQGGEFERTCEDLVSRQFRIGSGDVTVRDDVTDVWDSAASEVEEKGK